jgi:hypothetical protein
MLISSPSLNDEESSGHNPMVFDDRPSRGNHPNGRKGGLARLSALAGLLLAAAGCGESPRITQYTVPREPPAELRQVDRMLAAILAEGDQLWFFKLTGPSAAIAEVRPDFEKYLTSIGFRDGAPQWQLPTGWRQLPGDGIRFASVDVPLGRSSRALSVTKLSSQGDWQRDVTDNVQRWRGQLGLAPSGEPMAGAIPIPGLAANRQGVMIDLEGKSIVSGGMGSGSGPSMGMIHDDSARSGGPSQDGNRPNEATAASGSGAPAVGSRPFESIAPTAWRPGRLGPMRLAAFEAGPDDRKAEITVIEARGDERGNVARWLGQIASTVDEAAVDQILAARESLTIGDQEAGLFRLKGDQGLATSAVVIPWTDGSNLFIKMQGPDATVKEQDEALKQFAQSFKW